MRLDTGFTALLIKVFYYHGQETFVAPTKGCLRPNSLILSWRLAAVGLRGDFNYGRKIKLCFAAGLKLACIDLLPHQSN